MYIDISKENMDPTFLTLRDEAIKTEQAVENACEKKESEKLKLESTYKLLNKTEDELNSIYLEIESDRKNTTFRRYNDWFEQNNIKTYFSQRGEINKNAVFERCNRTIALYLQKFRLNLNLNNWVSFMDDVMRMYNNTQHSTTKKNPHDIFFNGKNLNKSLLIQ